MAHADAMAERLPLLYREGELLRQLVDLAALPLEILDEEALEVKRAHWFDATFNLDEAARLAALLDIEAEDWQTLATLRIWVHAFVNARLRDGAVTLEAIRNFVADYTQQFEAAVGIEAAGDAVVVENPPAQRVLTPSESGSIEPLQQFTIEQKGLDETLAGFLLSGLPEGPESVPVIANITTGEALVFLDDVPAGARLWIRPQKNGSVTATLENRDVTASLRSVSNLAPGQAWSTSQIAGSPRAIRLRRGANSMWFLPVAHFDAPGLDRYLAALADLSLAEGRFDKTAFDQSLFFQSPAVSLRAVWTESVPASFQVNLPSGSLISLPGKLKDALAQRDRLVFAVDKGVQKLRAAGVAATVAAMPFRESQGQMDFLTGHLPIVIKERGPTGIDHLPDTGGVFGVTEFENSTFR